MILRRFIEHLKEQNWLAVGLDVVVVVVGLFLGFQVERWWSIERDEVAAYERLADLDADLEWNFEILRRSIDTRLVQLESATRLLNADRENAVALSGDDFYEALADVSRTLTPRFRSDAYDVLISSGQIDLIEAPELKAELGEFFARIDELLTFNQGTWAVHRNTFEPFVNRKLDHAWMLRKLHPDRFLEIDPSYDESQFFEVIGDGEFEGVIIQKRHALADEVYRLHRIQEGAMRIKSLLDQYLNR